MRWNPIPQTVRNLQLDFALRILCDETIQVSPSRYNLTSENPETGELLVFNSMRGSSAIIAPSAKDEALALLAGGQTENVEMLSTFSRLGFLIDDQVDEVAMLKSRKKAGIHDTNRIDVILMPNMDCSFACPYCYETHDARNRMSPETRTSILNWMRVAIPGRKVMKLTWFGGEPLLSADDVVDVTRIIQHICDEHQVILVRSITTNGYHLSESLIPRLIEVGLLNYQITVDGPPAIHNQTRILRSGKGSFDRVFRNILLLARADPRVRISLRVNFNHRNIDSIPELLGLFPEDVRKQLRIVFEPIFGSGEWSATDNLSAKAISDTIGEFYLMAAELGYDVQHGGMGVGKLVYCYAERENQFIIDYKGDVFKCSVGSFSADERVGVIRPDGTLEHEPGKWGEWNSLPEFDEPCEDCVFLPLCMGGCRKDRLKNRQTGSYCSLVATNTSYALKSVAFGTFNEILRNESKILRKCAEGRQSASGCNTCNQIKQ